MNQVMIYHVLQKQYNEDLQPKQILKNLAKNNIET